MSIHRFGFFSGRHELSFLRNRLLPDCLGSDFPLTKGYEFVREKWFWLLFDSRKGAFKTHWQFIVAETMREIKSPTTPTVNNFSWNGERLFPRVVLIAGYKFNPQDDKRNVNLHPELIFKELLFLSFIFLSTFCLCLQISTRTIPCRQSPFTR